MVVLVGQVSCDLQDMWGHSLDRGEAILAVMFCICFCQSFFSQNIQNYCCSLRVQNIWGAMMLLYCFLFIVLKPSDDLRIFLPLPPSPPPQRCQQPRQHHQYHYPLPMALHDSLGKFSLAPLLLNRMRGKQCLFLKLIIGPPKL